MARQRIYPTEEELEKTYRMLKGMALRRQFRSDQDREDFIQNVMLSACRTYNEKLERHLSFKNLACGPAFRRSYQTYWRDYYAKRHRNNVGPLESSPGEDSVAAPIGSVKTKRNIPENVCDEMAKARWEDVSRGDAEPADRGWFNNRGREIEEIQDKNLADPADLVFRNCLSLEIEELESPYAELITFFLLGMTREEVAQTKNKSVSWAKKYTLLALERLLNRLRARGFIVEEIKLEQILS